MYHQRCPRTFAWQSCQCHDGHCTFCDWDDGYIGMAYAHSWTRQVAAVKADCMLLQSCVRTTAWQLPQCDDGYCTFCDWDETGVSCCRRLLGTYGGRDAHLWTRQAAAM